MKFRNFNRKLQKTYYEFDTETKKYGFSVSTYVRNFNKKIRFIFTLNNVQFCCNLCSCPNRQLSQALPTFEGLVIGSQHPFAELEPGTIFVDQVIASKDPILWKISATIVLSSGEQALVDLDDSARSFNLLRVVKKVLHKVIAAELLPVHCVLTFNV